MSWVTLTVDDVKSRMMEKELESIELMGDESPLTPKLDLIIRDITEEIRTKVLSCSLNTIQGADGTIPSECRGAAAVMARHALLGSGANLTELEGDVRKTEYDKACKYLEQISKCEVKIESAIPTEDITGESGGDYGGNDLLDF